VHDVEVLRGLVDFVGAERVLLGSDYPFDMGVERPAEIVRALQLPAQDEAAILGGNAKRLLGQEIPA
jgi:aminocarboxymuconate-semialdehyde decarboxylase